MPRVKSTLSFVEKQKQAIESMGLSGESGAQLQEELKQAIEAIDKMNIQDVTKVNYANYLKKMTTLGIDVFTEDEQIIVDDVCALPNLTENVYTKYLSVAYVIRRDLGLSTDLLSVLKRDTEYFEQNAKSPVMRAPVEPSVGKPIIQLAIDYMNNMYKAQNWNAFIINYLLINFQVRNMDLDLVVSTKKPDSDEVNYIYVEDSQLTYIRNEYKTSERYGPKSHDIFDIRMITACKNHLNGAESRFLLYKTVGGKEVRIERTGLASYIQNRTAVQQRALNVAQSTLADKTELEQIAENRGTSVEVIRKVYDHSYKKPTKAQSEHHKDLAVNVVAKSPR